MSRPDDESRTELAWREIVEHYGDRPGLDDDEVEARERAVSESERFRPPPAPPFPRPRTWQRGLAWAGLSVAPLIALVIALLSIYVPSVVGWALVAWFVGGFAYLVREMPRSPRDPWDDGSRI